MFFSVSVCGDSFRFHGEYLHDDVWRMNDGIMMYCKMMYGGCKIMYFGGWVMDGG